MTLTTDPGAHVDAHEQIRQPAGDQASTSASQRVVIGRYRLIEPLGRGGMGRVYRAHDDLLDRPVAVKLIYDDAVSERDLHRACAVEARAAARVSHPGVVRILDSGFDDGHCFVVMELAEGQTLAQLVRESGWLPVERALGLAAQVADALEEAHRQGVVHCDVKPGNLVVDAFERIRLVDFGIARVSNSSTGLTEQDIHGSAKYVAPEQVEGGKIDGRTDLYALGVVLFEMMAGRPPFTGENLASILAQRLIADAPSVRSVQPTIPIEVDRIVRRAMAREPDQRYQSAGELRDALRAAREVLHATERLPLGQVVPSSPWRVSRRGALQPRVAAVARQVGPWLSQSLQRIRGWAETIVTHPARPRTLRWPSLPAAVGMVALLGLLAGVAAAQCGMIAGASEGAMVAEPAEAAPLSIAAPVLAEPPPAPTEVPTTAPIVAPTEPPTPPPPTSTNPPPPATASAPPPEPTAAVAAPARPAPPVRALSAPQVSAPPPAPEPEAAPPEPEQQPLADDAKPENGATSNRPDDKKPDENKPDKKDANDPKPNTPPAAAKPEAPKPNVRPEIPVATATSALPQPTPKPAAPPPATKPQSQSPTQMKPTGSQPAPAPKPAPSNNQSGNGNGRGNNDEKQKKR
jgi:serine/threonine-protein kinase